MCFWAGCGGVAWVAFLRSPASWQGLRTGTLRSAHTLSANLSENALSVRTTQHDTIAPLCSRVMSQHQLLGAMHQTISASLARQHVRIY